MSLRKFFRRIPGSEVAVPRAGRLWMFCYAFPDGPSKNAHQLAVPSSASESILGSHSWCVQLQRESQRFSGTARSRRRHAGKKHRAEGSDRLRNCSSKLCFGPQDIELILVGAPWGAAAPAWLGPWCTPEKMWRVWHNYILFLILGDKPDRNCDEVAITVDYLSLV